jgi:hypothetical protein
MVAFVDDLTPDFVQLFDPLLMDKPFQLRSSPGRIALVNHDPRPDLHCIANRHMTELIEQVISVL